MILRTHGRLLASAALTSLLVPSPYVTAAWSIGETVLDYGIELSDGQSTVIVDKTEVGDPFDVEVTWRVDPNSCLLQSLVDADGDGIAEPNALTDDFAFGGSPSHVQLSKVEALLLIAERGKECRIGANLGEFVTVSRQRYKGGSQRPEVPIPPIGATVVVLRATAFFTPRQVTIKPGERVIWIYADGAKEPHTVTSGGCPAQDCSGGGKEFNSGVTLTKPGDTFAHTFTRPGTFEYHCELHTGNMRGTVTVTP